MNTRKLGKEIGKQIMASAEADYHEAMTHPAMYAYSHRNNHWKGE